MSGTTTHIVSFRSRSAFNTLELSTDVSQYFVKVIQFCHLKNMTKGKRPIHFSYGWQICSSQFHFQNAVALISLPHRANKTTYSRCPNRLRETKMICLLQSISLLNYSPNCTLAIHSQHEIHAIFQLHTIFIIGHRLSIFQSSLRLAVRCSRAPPGACRRPPFWCRR